MNSLSHYKIAFFGTSRFAELILQHLKESSDFVPTLIITTPDKPVGRKQMMTASPVKEFALIHSVPLLQPAKLRDSSFVENLGTDWDLFIVASYGKIIPQSILEIPRRKTINIHPSKLPFYRGASPLQNQILHAEQNVATTIMQMDEQVDHGPIIAQQEVGLTKNEGSTIYPSFSELESIMAQASAELLEHILLPWINNEIISQEQDHSQATFTSLLEKNDGEIEFNIHQPERGAHENYLKYLAYEEWPGTFFFIEKDHKKQRIVIKDAVFMNNEFIPTKVVPEGKKEMDYRVFVKSL